MDNLYHNFITLKKLSPKLMQALVSAIVSWFLVAHSQYFFLQSIKSCLYSRENSFPLPCYSTLSWYNRTSQLSTLFGIYPFLENSQCKKGRKKSVDKLCYKVMNCLNIFQTHHTDKKSYFTLSNTVKMGQILPCELQQQWKTLEAHVVKENKENKEIR